MAEQHGRIRIHETRYVRRLSLRRWQWGNWWLVALALGLDVGIVMWWQGNMRDREPWAEYIFPSILGLVALLLTYAMLIELFNSLHMTLKGPYLSVEQLPIPTGVSRTIDKAQIAQLFVEEKSETDNEGKTTKKNLFLILLKSGERIEIFDELLSPEEGHFIEKRLEAWLQIQDQLVRGESAKI